MKSTSGSEKRTHSVRGLTVAKVVAVIVASALTISLTTMLMILAPFSTTQAQAAGLCLGQKLQITINPYSGADGNGAKPGQFNDKTGHNAPGTTNNGGPNLILPGIAGTRMSNIKYVAYEIVPTDGDSSKMVAPSTNSGTGTDISYVNGGTTTTTQPAIPSTSGTNNVYFGTTKDGTVTIDVDQNNSGAFYLVEQVTLSDGIVAMAPFITPVPFNGWCNVQVYPKLQASADSSETLTVTPGQAALPLPTDNFFREQTSVLAGTDVTWNLQTAIADSLTTGKIAQATAATTANSTYIITNSLSAGLSLDTASQNGGITFAVVAQNLATGAIDGTPSVIQLTASGSTPDYTLTTVGSDLTISLTASGLAKVLVAKSAVSLPSSNDTVVLQTSITTTVGRLPQGITGSFAVDTYKAEVINAFGLELIAPVPGKLDPSGNIVPGGTVGDLTKTLLTVGNLSVTQSAPGVNAGPVVYEGSALLNVVDKNLLQESGAVFGLVKNADGTGGYLASDGKYYAGTISGGQINPTSPLPSGVSFVYSDPVTVASVSLTNIFNGLQVNPLALAGGSLVDGSVTNTDYFAVEVKAPLSHNLLPDVIKVTASLTPAIVTVTDTGGGVNLPFTGGAGLTGLLLLSGGLGGLALVLRKRHHAQTEQTTGQTV